MISATSESACYRTRFSNGTFEAFSDTTPDKGGAGAGFRPHELLEAALASCLNMTVRMHAAKKAIPLDAVTTRVQLLRGPDGATFRVEIELHGDSLTAQQRETLIESSKTCPVSATLAGPIRFAKLTAPRSGRS